MTAWEITNEDIALVLTKHDLPCPDLDDWMDEEWDRINDLINHDEVEQTILRYTDLEDQCEAMSTDIEEMLFKAGEIPSNHERQYKHP